MSPGSRVPAAVAVVAALGCAAPGIREQTPGAPPAAAVAPPAPCCGLEPPSAHHLRWLPPAEVATRYRFRLATQPPGPAAGEPTTVTVAVEEVGTDAGGGPLGLHRERRIHVTVLAEDRGELHHFHPEEVAGWKEMSILQGGIAVPVVFSHGGTYRVVAEFVEDGAGVRAEFPLAVAGAPAPPLRPDTSRVRRAEDLEISLETAEATLVAGRELNGVFRLRRGGEDVKDLDPYGGALAHIVVVGPDPATPPLHLHGGGQEYSHFRIRTVVPGYRGPKIYWSGLLEGEGLHRVFLLFRRNGAIHQVEFDLEVGSADEGTGS